MLKLKIQNLIYKITNTIHFKYKNGFKTLESPAGSNFPIRIHKLSETGKHRILLILENWKLK